MPNKIYINRKLIDEKNASLSIYDRSYLYGEGAFETMRAYNGIPAFCDMHYHRLKNNCETLKIELPLSEYAFQHDVIKLLNANKLKEAYVRVTVSMVGASVGLARPPKMKNSIVIFAKRFKGRPKETYENGARIVIVESVQSDAPEIAEIKSTNYLSRILARSEVISKKADEGLMRNARGFIVEGTATNLFIVRGGRIFTPPLTDGCLPGITRWVTLGVAETLKIPCNEEHLLIDDLKGAEEIFITGSTTEILPVREIIGITKKQKCPGPITVQMMKEYKKLLP